jgi:hypothetical protein
MAKIRNIKPEYPTNEKTASVSRDARLLHILMQSQCDDNGIMPANYTQIKLKVFPGDFLKPDDLTTWINELITIGLISYYEVDGQGYWMMEGWHDKESDFYQGYIKNFNERYPLPPNKTSAKPEKSEDQAEKEPTSQLLQTPKGVTKESLHTDQSVLERVRVRVRVKERVKEKERVRVRVKDGECEGKENSPSPVPVDNSPPLTLTPPPPEVCLSQEEVIAAVPQDANAPPCPSEDIIALYHRLCPNNPRVSGWTSDHNKLLLPWWERYPDLEYWEDYFYRVADSKLLTGRKTPRKGETEPFKANFFWLLDEKHFVSVVEGKYDD